MKKTTKMIHELLSQGSVQEHFNLLQKNQPTYQSQETSISEAYENFIKIAELIKGTSESGLFDAISYLKRNQILKTINAVHQQLYNSSQYKFVLTDANVKAAASKIITEIDNLMDLIESSNLYSKTLGLENYNEEAQKLTEIRNEYNRVLKDINDIKQLKQMVEDNNSRSDELKTQIEVNKINSQENLDVISKLKDESDKIFQNIKTSNDSVKQHESSIETKKLAIETYAKNIEEYKTNINILTEKARDIIAKEEIIDKLIESAHQALKLKSSEGISAAFSTQYEKRVVKVPHGGLSLLGYFCL